MLYSSPLPVILEKTQTFQQQNPHPEKTTAKTRRLYCSGNKQSVKLGVDHCQRKCISSFFLDTHDVSLGDNSLIDEGRQLRLSSHVLRFMMKIK